MTHVVSTNVFHSIAPWLERKRKKERKLPGRDYNFSGFADDADLCAKEKERERERENEREREREREREKERMMSSRRRIIQHLAVER